MSIIQATYHLDSCSGIVIFGRWISTFWRYPSHKKKHIHTNQKKCKGIIKIAFLACTVAELLLNDPKQIYFNPRTLEALTLQAMAGGGALYAPPVVFCPLLKKIFRQPIPENSWLFLFIGDAHVKKKIQKI